MRPDNDPQRAVTPPHSSVRPASCTCESHRVRIGRLWIDAISFVEALERIRTLVEAGRGGSVFTPNVDHIVQAEDNAAFRRAYRKASLSLVDGTPVLWTSRLLRTPLPEKISGSDLMVPLARLAGEHGWRVFLVGGSPGVGEMAAERLRMLYGVDVVGVEAPAVDAAGRAADESGILERIQRARPHLLLVAFGAPKQELWISRVSGQIHPAVAVGVGAGFDFVAGTLRRAPRWMSRSGLEWLYRLTKDPRRLWRRYLVRDPRFLPIIVRTSGLPRNRRVLPRR